MNLYGDDWDVERMSSEGVQTRFLHVGHRLGSALVGGTVMEVGPGYRGPYHLHHGNEELVLVLRRPRDRSGSAGRAGARARRRRSLPARPGRAARSENRSAEPARFLLLSSKVHPDVTERPEEGVVGVFVGDVPTMGRDAPFEAFFPRGAAAPGNSVQSRPGSVAGMATERVTTLAGPLGATPLAGGLVEFRVWAPRVRSVAVELESGTHELEPEAGRVHSVRVAAAVGADYRFRLEGGDAWPDPCSRFQPEGVRGPSRCGRPELLPLD